MLGWFFLKSATMASRPLASPPPVHHENTSTLLADDPLACLLSFPPPQPASTSRIAVSSATKAGHPRFSRMVIPLDRANEICVHPDIYAYVRVGDSRSMSSHLTDLCVPAPDAVTSGMACDSLEPARAHRQRCHRNLWTTVRQGFGERSQSLSRRTDRCQDSAFVDSGESGCYTSAGRHGSAPEGDRWTRRCPGHRATAKPSSRTWPGWPASPGRPPPASSPAARA